LALEARARSPKGPQHIVASLLPLYVGLLKLLACIDPPVFTQPVKPCLIELFVPALIKQTPRGEICPQASDLDGTVRGCARYHPAK
jgi:hypothetical protein